VYRFLIPALGLAFVSGLLAGSTITAWSLKNPPMAIIEDSGSDIATVSIEGIRNGALTGKIEGDVRLSAGGKHIEAGSGGIFFINDSKVLTNIVHIDIPEGMKFVASKKGKKYYPVDSATAAQIVPQNRIYFPDELSAERAGYVR
jgi:hypothetical protein